MDRIIVEYLANALWQVPLLVAGVGALLWALGAEVRTRHRVWLAVLALAVLIPLRGMQFPEAPVPMPPQKTVHIQAHPWTAAVVPAEDVVVPRPEAAPRMPILVFGEVSGRWLVRFYAVILAFAAWRIGRSWVAAQHLLRRSRSIDLAPRAMAIFAQAADHQNVPLPRLRQSDETISPVVIGAVRPVLLLPAGFDHLKDDEILAALSHEFAHLARRDYLVNLICQIVALPLAWHPAIQYVHKRIRDTREMLCDAVAAEEMASPVRYATCLVAFALRALDGHDAALATQGVSMFDNRILEERILHLTQSPEEPEPSTRLVRLAGATLGLIIAVAMALLFHITPTWADTIEPPTQLTPPQIELPVAPASPDSPVIEHTPPSPSADMQRAIDEESRQRDTHRHSLDEAQHQRDLAQRKRDEAQHALDQQQAQRDLKQRERDKDQAQRDLAEAQREAARDIAEAKREAEEEAREAVRESAQARREAIHEAEHQAAEAKRMAADIKRQVADATAFVRSPEFQTHMAELRTHMEELHDSMAELGQRMKDLDRQARNDK